MAFPVKDELFELWIWFDEDIANVSLPGSKALDLLKERESFLWEVFEAIELFGDWAEETKTASAYNQHFLCIGNDASETEVTSPSIQKNGLELIGLIVV